jgi:hypothetical protein
MVLYVFMPKKKQKFLLQTPFLDPAMYASGDIPLYSPPSSAASEMET